MNWSGCRCKIKRAVNQIHADHAERLLLAGVLLVEHPDVDDDFGWRLARPGLKPDAQPAAAFLLARETARRHGVGENEKIGFVAARRVEPLQQQIELVLQHGLQTLAADVAFGGAVNRVAHRHVVGGDGLGHRARGAADVEKPAGDLLARADLGERAILVRVAIDLERLPVGAESVVVHERNSVRQLVLSASRNQIQ